MRKPMKKLFLLLLLSLVIIISCVTTTKDEVILPPEPQRRIQKNPETIKDYAQIILYYDNLVKEWEFWAASVKKIIGYDGNIPLR